MEEFLSKYIGVIEPFKGGRAYEMRDGKLLGKVMDFYEADGMPRYHVKGGEPLVTEARFVGVVKYDPFILRQGVLYKLVTHLFVKSLPKDIVLHGVVSAELRSSVVYLNTVIEANGAIAVVIMPGLRTEIMRGFPVVELDFYANVSGQAVVTSAARVVDEVDLDAVKTASPVIDDVAKPEGPVGEVGEFVPDDVDDVVTDGVGNEG